MATTLLIVLPNHVSYLMAEVEQFKQADIDIRGHDDFLSESGGIMDFEEDRIRPKRRRQPPA